MFTENNRNGRTDTEIAFDRKLGVAGGADMLYDCKTESCSADTLRVGFIHSVEAFAKARQMLFLDTDDRMPELSIL